MGGGVMSAMPQRAADVAGHGSSMHQSGSAMQASFASTGVQSGVRPHQVRPHALVA
jgi:hypothetical protein